MALYVDGLIVVEREVEYGVRYTHNGVLPQEFHVPCEDAATAARRASQLDGQVVIRTVFTTAWETPLDNADD